MDSIFISYAKEDHKTAASLYGLLKSRGFKPWIDTEDLLPGQNWELEIDRAIRNSAIFLACLSTKSVIKHGFVQSELKKAVKVLETIPQNEIYLIPLRLDECDVPDEIRHIHWLDYFEDNSSEKLIQVIRDHFAKRKKKPSINTTPILPELVSIPSGNFFMGSSDKDRDAYPNEKPQHMVYVSDLFIAKYPITNEEFQIFLNDLLSRTQNDDLSILRKPLHWNDVIFPEGKGKHPVINISWTTANEYCQWLVKKTGKPYRLPTEAEWEKAARGSDSRLFPWGNKFDKDKCNSADRGRPDTTPVGYYSPQGDSPYGCADMVGNIWEWCSDIYNEKEYLQRAADLVTDPKGPTSGGLYVVRGGSFGDVHADLRCARRGWVQRDYRGWYYGFRLALTSAS